MFVCLGKRAHSGTRLSKLRRVPLRRENGATALVTGSRASLLLITTTEQCRELPLQAAAELSTIEKHTVAIDTQAHEQLLRHRRVWEQKPILRRVYNDEFFARLLASRKQDGISVEVGAGPGFFKQSAPDVVSTDLIWCPWLDAIADAQQLPFRSNSVANVFGLDMLHHLATPMTFLSEVSRILVPGGRLILVEPWITPFSYLIFRFLHQERCDLSETPWLVSPPGGGAEKLAFDGNQAIPYLLFGPKHRSSTLGSLPELRLAALEPFCLFAYLLSGGFKPMNLLPEFLYPALSRFERATSPLWRRLAALRVLLVLEKVS
jgi:SAM-dependent methyltransferase